MRRSVVDLALGGPTHEKRQRSDGIGTTIEHNEAKSAHILPHRRILGEANPLLEFSVTSALTPAPPHRCFPTTGAALPCY
jgi:hypothetical protein